MFYPALIWLAGAAPLVLRDISCEIMPREKVGEQAALEIVNSDIVVPSCLIFEYVLSLFVSGVVA